MAALQGLDAVQTRHTGLDYGLRALESHQVSDGTVVYAASGDGIAAYHIADSGQVSVRHVIYYPQGGLDGFEVDLSLIEGADGMRLTIFGGTQGGAISYALNARGYLSDSEVHALQGSGAYGTAVQLSSGRIATPARGTDAFEVYRTSDSGNWQYLARERDTNASYADSIGAMARIDRTSGTEIFLVASQTEYGVSSYRMSGNDPRHVDSIGPNNGPGIMVPTALETVIIDGQAYALVASAPQNGAAGGLSVIAVSTTGQLSVADHVLDTRYTRFGQVQALDAIEIDGHHFVVAGGGDQGLSLFTLLPNGQLVFLDTIATQTGTVLDQITAISLVHAGDTLMIMVATQGAGGLSRVSYDVSRLGDLVEATSVGQALSGTGRNDTLMGGAGDDTLTTGQGDDLLLDGAGSDVMTGGSGADVFVLSADGTQDRITDFNANQDRLDLSSWPFLYDPDALTVEEYADGVRLIWGDERLEVMAASGQTLTGDAVRNAVGQGPTRTIIPEEDDTPQQGLVMVGTAGSDEMHGGDGADDIFGSLGDDLLFGTDGADTLRGGWDNDTIYGEAGRDLIKGGRGEDVLYGGAEVNKLLGQGGADTLHGGSERDVLNGGGGWDVLFGNSGNDRVKGGPRVDLLFGGDGPDMLFGNAGEDRLEGGDDDDLLNGGGDNDRLCGERGDDTMKGGAGADVFVFASNTGEDHVVDFTPGVDIIELTGALTRYQRDAQEVVRLYASQEGADVVFDFHSGNRIVLENTLLTSNLANDLLIV